MKKHLDIIINFVSSIGIYFTATAIFPHIDNPDLIQANVDIDKLTGVIMLGLYLAFSGLTFKWKPAKRKRYIYIGLPCIGIFIIVLFTIYYPFVNNKIVNVKFECGGTYVKGDSVNYSKLNLASKMNYDSLSVFAPSILIQQTNCDPSVAWTHDSIEHNFNGIMLRYILTLLLFSVGIFSSIKSAILNI